MPSIESASALLDLDAMPLVFLDLHTRSWTDAPWY